jgi:hypothetical protein
MNLIESLSFDLRHYKSVDDLRETMRWSDPKLLADPPVRAGER